MRTGKRRMICLILSVILFLSGVCFEQLKTDSFLVNSSAESETSSIRSCQTVLSDADVYNVNILRDCNRIKLQQSGRCTCPKREIRNSLSLLHFSNSLWIAGNNLASLVLIQSFDQKPSELVTQYIHKSDGKKRIQ